MLIEVILHGEAMGCGLAAAMQLFRNCRKKWCLHKAPSRRRHRQNSALVSMSLSSLLSCKGSESPLPPDRLDDCESDPAALDTLLEADEVLRIENYEKILPLLTTTSAAADNQGSWRGICSEGHTVIIAQLLLITRAVGGACSAKVTPSSLQACVCIWS